MTKCSKNEANLKSSAYNQTGQNIFEQLSAYNSMSSHLRRVLLAKSVVDARNKTYMRKRKDTCRPADCKSELMKTGLTREFIDKLAYDSLHHPADVLRMSFDPKYTYQRKDQKRYVDCYEDYEATCPGSVIHDRFSYEESDRTTCRSRPTSRTNKSGVFGISGQPTKHRDSYGKSKSGYGRKIKSADARSSLKMQNYPSEERYEENSSPDESYSDFATPDTNRLSSLANSSGSSEDREPADRREKTITAAETAQEQDESAKYAEFAYEITREVMQNNLYTDEELQDVFERHIEKNKDTLNMSKMLYEIYQLKISLNISDDSDDELEDLIHTQQLLKASRIRPPTPPKVLNENKVQEKLMSYQNIAGVSRKSSGNGCRKSVVLIDANPELVVTERDILTSLVDADVDINRVQKICKSIFQKGREAVAKVQSVKEYKDVPSNENPKGLRNFIEVSERDKSSVTNDLVPQEDKDIQAEMNGKSM